MCVPQDRIAADLKDLRNNSVFAFFMINALFVLVVFLLQLNKDNLHVKWPFGVKTNITYDETTQEVKLLRSPFINRCVLWFPFSPKTKNPFPPTPRRPPVHCNRPALPPIWSTCGTSPCSRSLCSMHSSCSWSSCCN